MTKDLIILIPGIGGSRLERDGKAIYDLSFGALPRLIWNWVGGGIAFGGGSAKPDDGVVATGLFNNQLIPGWFGVDDYDGLVRTLKSVVKDPARQFFAFPYDWRASNRWAAEELDRFARARLHDWQQAGGGPGAKLWLVGHSMGGIVARYFLEVLGGAAITRRLVTIGTPHRGAPKAIDALVNGMKFGLLDFSKVIRSFASTYELLPQYPALRIQDGAGAETLVRFADFFAMGPLLPTPVDPAPPSPPGLPPLPNIDAARLRDALDLHRKIREPVIARIKSGEPSPYRITCFFNRRQATPLSARWRGGELKLFETPTTPAPDGDNELFHRGDGTVPGISSVPIEWTDTAEAIAIDEKHVAMPSAQGLTDVLHNFANPLTALPYATGDRPSDASLGLAVPPLVMAGQSFDVVLDAVRDAEARLTVAAVGTAGAAPVFDTAASLAAGSPARLALTLTAPGTYRVTVQPAGAGSAGPAVSDWVVVTQPPA